MLRRKSIQAAAVAVLLVALMVPAVSNAQDGLQIAVTAAPSCDTVEFSLTVDGGSGEHDLTIDFGDGETALFDSVSSYPLTIEHAYLVSGDYGWAVAAHDSLEEGVAGIAAGMVSVGPTATIASDPFPPLLTLVEGSSSASFSAEVEGGEPPYAYSWDLDGDGTPNSNESGASFSYTESGSYSVNLLVLDSCGLSASDSLVVVVFDSEMACHPRAQQIAQAVSSLFPGQAAQLYSCEDIFGFFNGDLTGNQLGFGRMWHAYKMALTMEELTWEEILDWHLQGSGWGLLSQLDRSAEALTEIGLGELVELVLTGQASVKDVRMATRAVVESGATFEDALARLQSGMSPGELRQFYQITDQQEMDAKTLDEYLDGGLKLSDIRHASALADRYLTDVPMILEARSEGNNWGEIGQALRLANEEVSAEEILKTGVEAFRRNEHEQERAEREAERNAREVQRLAEQYGVTETEVEALFASCFGDSKCVRDHLRDSPSAGSQEDRKAAQIANQYGVPVSQVLDQFHGACGGDWSCVRAYFREQERAERGGGKKD